MEDKTPVAAAHASSSSSSSSTPTTTSGPSQSLSSASAAGAVVSENPKTPKAQAPLQDKPSFTFIDHNDSFQTKKTTDTNARKAIRSHVMRDVRRRERLAGLKRPTRKEERKDSTNARSQSSADDTLSNEVRAGASSSQSASGDDELALPLRANMKTKIKPKKAPSKTQPPLIRGQSLANSSKMTDRTQLSLRRTRTPSPEMLDPFSTLPGGVLESTRVDALLKHCISVFIPMTFPIEKGRTDQLNLRMAPIFEKAMSQPQVFNAHLCLSAAHRSVMHGKTGKAAEDFYVMKAKCIKAVNEMMPDPSRAFSDEAIETVVLLETSTTLLGLYEEAMMHLKALRKICQLRGGVNMQTFKNNPGLMHSILIHDAKASLAMLSKPTFPVPWKRKPLSCETRQRITPLKDSPLQHLASSFASCPHLSLELLEILHDMRDLAFFDDFSSRDPDGLTTSEHEIFRHKTYELEHGLLEYPYRDSRSLSNIPSNSTSDIDLDPIEAICRVASLMHINYTAIVSDQSYGLGRLLVFHLLQVFRGCPWDYVPSLPLSCQDVLLWALFIGAHGSQSLPEHPWFIDKIADMALWRGWTVCAELSTILQGYFFIESKHANSLHWVWVNVFTVLQEKRRAAMDTATAGLVLRPVGSHQALSHSSLIVSDDADDIAVRHAEDEATYVPSYAT